MDLLPLPSLTAANPRFRYEGSVEAPRGFPVDALRSHQSGFHDLLSQLSAIVWEADPLSFQTIFVSRHAEEILGYPLQAWLADPEFFPRHLHPDERTETIDRLRRIACEGGDHMLEFRMISSSGGPVWLRVLVHAVCDWQGRPRSLHAVMIDVDHQRSVSARSHDAYPASPNGPSGASSSRSSGRGGHPLSLRLEGPDDSPPAAIVDVNETMRSLEPALSALLGRTIELTLELGADSSGVRIERQQLERMIRNLALHARDSMMQGGQLLIETSVYDPGQPSPRWLVLTVSDTGVGLDVVLRARVFESLFAPRAPARRATVSLAAVEEIVADAEGAIVLRHEPTGGTRFDISFPLVEAEEGRPVHGRHHLSVAADNSSVAER